MQVLKLLKVDLLFFPKISFQKSQFFGYIGSVSLLPNCICPLERTKLISLPVFIIQWLTDVNSNIVLGIFGSFHDKNAPNSCQSKTYDLLKTISVLFRVFSSHICNLNDSGFDEVQLLISNSASSVFRTFNQGLKHAASWFFCQERSTNDES